MYREILDSANDAILVAEVKTGLIIDANQCASDLTGRPREELVGLHQAELHPPDERERYAEIFREHVQSGAAISEDLYVQDANGVHIPVEISARVMESEGQQLIVGVFRDLRARRAVEADARERARQLHTLMQNLPGMVYRCRNDRQRTTEFVNDGCLALTGYRPDQLTNNRDVSFGDLIHPEDQETVWQSVQTANSAHEPFQINYRLLSADGGTKQVWEQGRGVFDERGELLALEGFITDISARAGAESELKRRQHRLHILSEASCRINAVLEIPAVLRTLVEAARELVDADSGTAAIVEGGELVFSEYNKTGELFPISYRFPRSYGVPGHVMEIQAPYRSDDAVNDAHVIPEIQQALGFKVLVDVPILGRDEELLGCFEMHDKVGGVPFDEEDVRLLEGLAASAATAIENARVLKERERAETRLTRRGELVQLLRDVAMASNEAETVDEAMQSCLDQVCRATGFCIGHAYLPAFGKTVDLEPTSLWYLADPERHERFRINTMETHFGLGVGLPGRVWESGKPAWIEDVRVDENFPRAPVAKAVGIAAGYAFPVLERDRVVAVLEFFSDIAQPLDQTLFNVLETLATQMGRITERKRNELHLNQFGQIWANTSEGVIVTDADMNIVSVNPAFTQLTGYTEAEVFGKNPRLLQSGRQDRAFYSAMWKHLRDHGRWQGEIWNRRKNGEIYPEWLSISMAENDSGEVQNYIGVFSDISLIKESQSRLEHLASHDPLTDLPNRLLFKDRFTHAIERARRGGKQVALLFLDLDEFKDVNDSLGHPAGDQMLQQVAARLRAAVREQDTVARFGGDEFVLLLEGLDVGVEAARVSQKLLYVLREPFAVENTEVTVGASIGISIYPLDGEDETILMKNSDSALYRAKSQGRNNYQFYTSDLTTNAMSRLTLENELRRALAESQFELYYQPQVDLNSGQVFSVEALLRWHHPERGLLYPEHFLSRAEESGLIEPIGAWVLQEACRQNKAWQDAGLDPVRMAVNISGRQFLHDRLTPVVLRALEDSGLEPKYLELEITESVMMSDRESVAAVMEALQQLGVHFALDDFGTGYSSLSYLKRFPINRIKIDRSFIRDIITDPDSAAIALSIVAMARQMNREVTAEGVEDEARLRYLKRNNCDAVQGFYFSKALPAAEVETLLGEDGPYDVSFDDDQDGLRTLLLVDDDANVLRALKRLLRRDDYRILVAEGAQQGFELLAEHDIGVIVSDQRMPAMNGTEFLRRVKALYPHTVRMILSGYTELESITGAINEGAVYKFLTKPWDDEQLRDHIKEAFRLSEMARENERLQERLSAASDHQPEQSVKTSEATTP